MNTNNVVLSNENAVIESALKILESRILYDPDSPSLTSPQASKDFMKLKLFTFEHEVCLSFSGQSESSDRLS